MRRLIVFPCVGETLIATLDEASRSTGLMIVSGGNEIRCGAHRGMALLAADIAARGFPVFRYDRRGIGDSSGVNQGFLSASDDLRAAVAAFRTEAPQVTRLVGFGNCDAASALALFARDAGVGSVLLANPWLIESADGLPPAGAIRTRYGRRLREPATWLRLARGKIGLRMLAAGVKKIAFDQPDTTLTRKIIAAIEAWGEDAAIILAEGDATAIAFRAAAPHLRVETIATDSHSFARWSDVDALRNAVLAALER